MSKCYMKKGFWKTKQKFPFNCSNDTAENYANSFELFVTLYSFNGTILWHV